MPATRQPPVQRDADMRRRAAHLLPQCAGLNQITGKRDVIGKGGERAGRRQGQRGPRQALQRIAVGQFQPPVDRRRHAAQGAGQGRIGAEIFGRGAERAIGGEVDRVACRCARHEAGQRRQGRRSAGGNTGLGHDRTCQCGERRVDFRAARGGGEAGRAGVDDVALAFQQLRGAAIFDVQGEAIIALDAQEAALRLAIVAPAIGGGAAAQIDGFGAETLTQNDVDDLLRRGIAV